MTQPDRRIRTLHLTSSQLAAGRARGITAVPCMWQLRWRWPYCRHALLKKINIYRGAGKSIIGGRADIHFLHIYFLWKRLFSQSVNMNIWISAPPPIIEFPAPLNININTRIHIYTYRQYSNIHAHITWSMRNCWLNNSSDKVNLTGNVKAAKANNDLVVAYTGCIKKKETFRNQAYC
jgi:hypothetical protein